MNKKTVTGIIVGLVGLALIALAIVLILNRKGEQGADQPNDNQNISQTEGEDKVNGKTLVVYYSAQNHTKAVAEKIAQNLGADIFEIVPEEIYSEEDLDWTDDGSRVNREHEDESLREIALENTTVENWAEYETVLVGYPIWWAIAAWPVDTFVKANDFTDKTVIPFCTSTSSGLGESGELLAELAGSGKWLTGCRFSSNPTDTEIKTWTDSLK